MAGSQKIALWGPQRTPLGILRVKLDIQNTAFKWHVTTISS